MLSGTTDSAMNVLVESVWEGSVDLFFRIYGSKPSAGVVSSREFMNPACSNAWNVEFTTLSSFKEG